MIISVTHADITEGVKNACNHCPIALAIKRAFNCDCVMVLASFDIIVNSQQYTSEDPETVQEFINNFDNGFPVQPFSFTLQKGWINESFRNRQICSK
jgi:hypothetical protein